MIESKQEIEEELAALPPGTIVRRNIRGIDRFYHQWRENGKTLSRYLKPEEIEPLRARIDRRKELIRAHGELIRAQANPIRAQGEANLVGRGHCAPPLAPRPASRALPRLAELAYSVSPFFVRHQVNEVITFLRGSNSNPVLVLGGLPRSGKTVILRQTIAALSPEERANAAYLAVCPGVTPDRLMADIASLRESGTRFIFIDGLERSAEALGTIPFITDMVAGSDVRIVLAGSIPALSRLRDVSIVNANPLPFSEFISIHDNRDFQFFIEHGGAPDDRFATAASTSRYLEDALTSPQREALIGLNHVFLSELLSTLPPSLSPTLDSHVSTDISRLAKSAAATIASQTIKEAIVAELADIGIIEPFLSLTPDSAPRPRTDWLMPMSGLRFQLARSLLDEMLDGPECAHCGAAERKMIRDAVTAAISERTMAEQVMLRAIRTRQRGHENISVFRIRFAVGGFDMVIADRDDLTCELYQVFNADKRSERQTQYLLDLRKLDAIEHRYGMITVREVLYTGRDFRHSSGVFHHNVRSFLGYSL